MLQNAINACKQPKT